MEEILFVILLVALASCTTINIKTVDYCHNLDGSVRTDDPRCAKDPDPITINGEVYDHGNRRQP